MSKRVCIDCVPGAHDDSREAVDFNDANPTPPPSPMIHSFGMVEIERDTDGAPKRRRLTRPICATSSMGPGRDPSRDPSRDSSHILIHAPGISAHATREIEFSTISQISGRKRKRQKIHDQMKGSIDSPPSICSEIYGVDTNDSHHGDVSDGGLTYTCPSRSTPGRFHQIKLKIEEGKTRFSCTCDHMGGVFDQGKNSCSHIRATVIKIMLDLIQTHQSALDVNDITELMNAMMV